MCFIRVMNEIGLNFKFNLLTCQRTLNNSFQMNGKLYSHSISSTTNVILKKSMQVPEKMLKIPNSLKCKYHPNTAIHLGTKNVQFFIIVGLIFLIC